MLNIHQKKEPSPDYTYVEAAARNIRPKRLPLYEHGIAGEMIEAIIGVNPYERWFSADEQERREAFRQFWSFWRIMGYDTASMEAGVCGALVGGGALGAHQEGCIKDMGDFQKYPWDSILERYKALYTPVMDSFAATIPPGMKGVGGVGNGVFESVQDLVGYVDLCYIKSDDPELYALLFQRMGDLQFSIWQWFMERYGDAFCVLRFGDDLGFKSSPLISGEDIRKLVLPQYRRVTDLVHSYGKPFLLHSCGCIFEVMEDIIRDGGIDAKHSNEDQIAPFAEWVDRYGDRIGNFGGIDLDIVCRSDEKTIQAEVTRILDQVAGKGGIAFSTGNSIPNYVPVDHYVAMVEAVRIWRGE